MIDRPCQEETKVVIVVMRKVACSGHISYGSRPYFVSTVLTGTSVRVVVGEERLIVDTLLPIHKEFPLKRNESEGDEHELGT